MFGPFVALARSSTFWLGAMANVAAIATTGQVNVTLLIATLASYSAKEGMRYIAQRPTSADVVLETAIAQIELLEPSTDARFRSSDAPAEYEALFATRVRPVLRHLRSLRRTPPGRDGDRDLTTSDGGPF